MPGSRVFGEQDVAVVSYCHAVEAVVAVAIVFGVVAGDFPAGLLHIAVELVVELHGKQGVFSNDGDADELTRLTKKLFSMI